MASAMTAVYAPGTRIYAELGSGQAHALGELRRSVRHPSRTWHRAPAMRAFGRSPGTAHRAIRRLVALGIIAVQSALGRDGFVRFTFAVRFWRTRPLDRRGLARMRAAAPGQLVLIAAPAGPVLAAPPPELDPPRARPAIIHAGSMAPTRYETCALCGFEGPVRMGVYQLEGRFEYGLRCVDHDACNQRRGVA
jgi:hypothetical protein